MRPCPGIYLCDVFPGATAEIGKCPKIAGRDIESPHGSAKWMAELRGGLFPGEVDRIDQTSPETERIRLVQRTRTKTIEAGRVDLRNCADCVSEPVIDRTIGEATIDDLATRRVDVKVRYPSPPKRQT